MVNEPEMLLLTTCVPCSGILLSVCVFEIALGFCRPTHGCSGPTNGRRATLPNTNPSWDGFLPAHPLMLGADQREAVVGAGHRGMLRHLANSSSLAAFFGLSCQQIRRDPGLQVFLPLLQRHQLLVRGAVVVDWVAAFAPAPQIDGHRGKSARAMIIQVRVEVGGVEPVPVSGMLAPHGAGTDVLAYHCSVLALHQRVVRGPVGSRFGELRQ